MRNRLEQEAYIDGFKQGIELAIKSIQENADLFIKMVNSAYDDMRGEE